MAQPLAGKVGLVVGVANTHSIATGCARAFRAAGAELALTYLDDRARPFVEPVAREVEAAILAPLDVEHDGQLEAVMDRISAAWGRLDFLLHAIAFCPSEDLHGRVVDCSRAGFARAMDISVHSLIRMTRLAEPLMRGGGSILTVSYYGALAADGVQFDDSFGGPRGEGITFPLGAGQVIPGWDEGIALLNEGARALFVIPADSDLGFYVQLDNIQ